MSTGKCLLGSQPFLSHFKRRIQDYFFILHNFTFFIVTAPCQLQAILATIEQRRHQPEPNFGRSEHNPRSITATDQVIPDLTSHTWHWFGCQIHWCWCCNSRCRWFRFVLVKFFCTMFILSEKPPFTQMNCPGRMPVMHLHHLQSVTI